MGLANVIVSGLLFFIRLTRWTACNSNTVKGWVNITTCSHRSYMLTSEPPLYTSKVPCPVKSFTTRRLTFKWIRHWQTVYIPSRTNHSWSLYLSFHWSSSQFLMLSLILSPCLLPFPLSLRVYVQNNIFSKEVRFKNEAWRGSCFNTLEWSRRGATSCQGSGWRVEK